MSGLSRRLTLIAIVLAATLAVAGRLAHAVGAAPNCDQWSSHEYFRTATVETVKACLEAGADPGARENSTATPLHEAAAHNENPLVIQVLLEAGADPMARDWIGDTPLHEAAAHNENPLVIEALLEAGADPNARDKDKDTPLHSAAASNQNPRVIQVLLEAGADPNPRNSGKTMPLHKAALYNENPMVVQALLAGGADPKARDAHGATPLEISKRFKDPAMIDFLRRLGDPPIQSAQDCRMWPTRMFFRAATVETVKGCLEADAAPMIRNRFEETPLHRAAQHSKAPGVIEALLAAGADLDAQAENRWTPLHSAVEYGNLEAVQALLGAGADVDAVSRGGFTPLWEAVTSGNVAVSKELLASGADPMADIWGLPREGIDPTTPLDDAKHPAVIELLQAAVKTAGQDCNLWNTKRYFQGATPESVTACLGTGSNPREEDGAGITPLHRGARYNENPEVTRILIDAGAGLEARDVKGFTPLRWAVNEEYWELLSGPGGNENLAVLQALLDVGADPDARDEYGDTVLHVAIREVTMMYHHNRRNRRRAYHYPAVIQRLLDAGADPDARSQHRIWNWNKETPLHWVVGRREIAPDIRPILTEALLSAGADFEARDSNGRTPLHEAAGYFDPDVLQALLSAGADLEARDDERRTPLHLAAAEAQEAVEILIEAGADVEVRDEDGDTPLHRVASFAESWGDRDLVAAVIALLSAGANPVARNGEGKTPWDLAQANEKLRKSAAYMWLKAAQYGLPRGGAASAPAGGPGRNAVVPATGGGLADAAGKQPVQRQARERLPYQPEMVKIPGGDFRMGCVSGEDCFSSEKPVHAVRVEAFELGKYEVTYEEYDRFTAATGRKRAADMGWGRGRRPVIGVTWEDAVAYTRWLSQQAGGRYRLPTEAEWEYAARAGTVTAYGWENGDYSNQANCGDDCGSRWSDRSTAPVGSFAPNGWGLHDMHGNVWEWVQDCWNRNYRGAPADGTAWESGDCSRRVMRGGSWTEYARYLRSASRFWHSTWIRSNITGFRVARTITP